MMEFVLRTHARAAKRLRTADSKLPSWLLYWRTNAVISWLQEMPYPYRHKVATSNAAQQNTTNGLINRPEKMFETDTKIFV